MNGGMKLWTNSIFGIAYDLDLDMDTGIIGMESPLPSTHPADLPP
jgi:hypothetical protein